MSDLRAAELELALKVTREELLSWPVAPTLEEYLYKTARAFEEAGLIVEAAQIRYRLETLT